MKKSFPRRCAAAVLAAAASLMPASALPAPLRASAASGVIYASPNGSGDGSSVSSPTTVAKAISSVSAGGYIYLLEGTYKFSSPIKIDNSNNGSSGKYKTIAAYNGAAVTFDFSGESTGSSNYGIILDGSYWHFYGFTVTRAGDNGMLLAGNNNIIENMVFSENQDTGLQISRYRSAAASISDWPTNNLVKNCTSRNNCDDATMENADGFAAKLTCGQGNVFDGCFSYNNSDDGWDLYAKAETGAIGVVTIRNCAAFRNGYTESGKGYGDCDGNGFKLGGGGVGTRHVVENCLAFENLNCGFTDNNNPEFGDMTNCTAYNNNLGGKGKANYLVYRSNSTAAMTGLVSYFNTSRVTKTNAPGIAVGTDKFKGVMKNTLYYNGGYYYGSFTASGSAVKSGSAVSVSDSEFSTLSVSGMGNDFHQTARNADGSPNFGGFAETKGTYKSIGYHFSSGVTQKASPSIPNTSGGGSSSQTDTYTAASFTEGAAYMIQNAASGLYLEVANNAAENSANVQQWEANGDGTNGSGVWNTWKLYSAGDGYYYIASCVGDGGTYVLDVDGKKSADGTNIAIYQYKGADNQKFMLTQNADGTYKIRTKVASEQSAVEVASGSHDYGANVQEWTVNGADCQDWKLIPVSDPGVSMDTSVLYTFSNVHSGLVMDAADGLMADNTNVRQWGANGYDCQKWILKEFGSGNYYYIRSAQDQTYVMKAESSADGGNIDIVTYSTKDSAMLFRFTKNLDGSYGIITHASADKALVEVAAASLDHGAHVQQWSANGNA
ncbi:MAG: RICIN domain-containing protein, partial [Oscillospiraceae bacterium]|nr:RICIN domain-containing protein [Oscillospiraceae bacterium]